MANHTPVHMNLENLLSRYLDRQAQAFEEGVEGFDAEVTPYDAGPVQPIDAKLAWDETKSVLALYGVKIEKSISAPPGWGTLVAEHEPVVALPIAFGNFPQLVRNFHVLLKDPGAEIWPTQVRPTEVPGLKAWVDQAEGVKLLAALGALRLGKQFALADTLIERHDQTIPENLTVAWANEKAALAWHRGNHDDALAKWRAMEPSPVVLFNRGMAGLLFKRDPGARADLETAIERLPEGSAWQFLGRLYLTMGR